LKESNGRGLGVVADDEVDFTDIQAFFPDRCGNEDVEVAILKFFNDLPSIKK
jgi:hypothetical protein